MNNWKKTTLGEVCNFRRGHDLPKYDMQEGMVPVAGSNGIIGYHDKQTNIEPCITIGRSGNVGTPYYYEKCWAHNTVLYIDDYKGNDPKFIYYFIKTLNLGNYSGGSAVPTLNRNHIHPIEVYFPIDIDEQKRIADVLSALDDKIEVNNKINENLEAQAQAIFKQWFVDFEFPDTEGKPYKTNGGEFIDSELGEIPIGWKVGTLTQIASYLNGLAMQKFRPEEDEKGFPVLKIKELRQGCCDSSSDLCSERIDSNYIINNGDIIFSWSGTLMIDFWTGGICGLNQHLFKVESKKYEDWFVFLWTKHHLEDFIRIAKDKAVTMGHIKREHLDKAMVLIPTSEIYNNVSNILKPIFSSIINLRIENKNLSEIRDSLLPRLMSGEVRV
ncbi:MAG: restriction endonuclease subunit S [Bacteroidia bacterium]|nr:restriction endonuclease subunit S [Bacteroidia bacterium]